MWWLGGEGGVGCVWKGECLGVVLGGMCGVVLLGVVVGGW